MLIAPAESEEEGWGAKEEAKGSQSFWPALLSGILVFSSFKFQLLDGASMSTSSLKGFTKNTLIENNPQIERSELCQASQKLQLELSAVVR